MFQYEEILGIKMGDKVIIPECLDKNKILLLPDYINDVLRKINGKQIPEGLVCSEEGANGYIFIYDNENSNNIIGAINPEGKVIYFEYKIPRSNAARFYDDCLIVNLEKDDNYIFGYIDGETGKFHAFPKDLNIEFADGFFEGKARVQIITDENRCFVYLNKKGKVISPQYFPASNFYKKRAVVANGAGCQIINEKFQCIVSLPSQNIMHEMVKAYNKHTRFADYFVKLREDRTLIDGRTRYSVYVPGILRSLASHFDIPLIEGSIEEQIVYLVGEMAKKGTYVYDVDTGLIEEAEMVKGVQISNENGVRITSFDEIDTHLIRIREKEVQNEKV